MKARLGESQRDSSSQPRVAESARLPWGCSVISTQPHRGCVLGHAPNRHNPGGVDDGLIPLPRVARASQPWAEFRYPFGVMRAAGSDAEKATLQNTFTATSRQIDTLVHDCFESSPEEIVFVEADA